MIYLRTYFFSTNILADGLLYHINSENSQFKYEEKKKSELVLKNH